MGNKYFVLMEGTVKVTVYQPGTNLNDPNVKDKIVVEKFLKADPNAVDVKDRMIGFGEIALLQNDKRTASIHAVTDCETWVLQGDVFKQIIAVGSIKRRNISLQYLNKVDLFSCLEQYDKIKLIDGLQVRHLKQGEYVFRENDQGDHFFSIEEGEVECLKENG